MRGIIPLLLCFFVLGACSEDESADKQGQQAPEFKVAAPYVKTITEWDEYTGRFRAVSEVELRARVSGYLDKTLFTDGQIVKKGQPLFIIDQRPFNIALNSAKAQYEEAKKNFNRISKLRKKLASATGGKNYIETVWGRGYVLREPDGAEEDLRETA